MSGPVRLWLDDMRQAPEGWVWVKTARDAIEVLGRGGVVAVSLDHDLGSDENGTGQVVASWIEAEAHHGRLARLEWRIHSMNPVGAGRMRVALERADAAWSHTGAGACSPSAVDDEVAQRARIVARTKNSNGEAPRDA